MKRGKVKSKPARRQRSPILTDAKITIIVDIIRQSETKATWDEVCSMIHRETGHAYSRQALNNYVQIKAAYAALNGRPRRKKTKSLTTEQKKIILLEKKVAELEMINNALLEKFGRWAVNASYRNLTEADLDQPLRQINRSENF
jgi:transposase